MKEFFQKNKLIVTAAALAVVLVGLIVGLVFSLISHDAPDTSDPSSASSDTSEPTIGPTASDPSSDASDTQTEPADTKGGQTSMTTGSKNSDVSKDTKPVSTPTTSKTAGQTETPSALKEYLKYNVDTWLSPVWKGSVVYNESIMFFPNAKTKEIESAPLLYKPDKVIAVWDSELGEKYEEGRDYTVENGRIKLTANTRIATWNYDQYYLPQPASVPIASASASGRYVNYASGDQFAVMQLAVTYTHSDKWTGKTPTYAGSRLPTTIGKLKNKQQVSIVYYGDSIMTGCEASSTHNLSPMMPIYPDMVTEKLKKAYGYTNIKTVNTAVGGKETNWGLAEVHERVSKYSPDLVLIAFGMNDSGVPISVEQYEQNIRAMIKDVRATNPKAEFLLISTTLPNPDCAGWTNLQPKYKTALENIVSDTSGTALVPMTEIHQYLLTKKRYDDMNGNGVNHPNDFLARIYGQAVCQTLIEGLQ